VSWVDALRRILGQRAGYRLSDAQATGYRPSIAPARGCRLHPRHTGASFARARGFTLIELVAAFVIFALGFGVLLQVLGSALHTTAQSAGYSKAAMWAQSLLDTQGIGEPLEEGTSSGRFDDQYRWQMQIAKYEPPPVTSTVDTPMTANANGLITAPVQGLDLFEIDLDVSWGTQYLTHHARFATVRAMNPRLEAGNDAQVPPRLPRRQR
jgi:general secretion pathway protein I